jgi:hypothetical protein
MNSNVTHRLVGYDRASGAVAVEHDVPDIVLEYAKRLAGVGPDDPDAVLCYKLSRQTARDLAGVIKARINADGLSFFMEGFVAPR